MNYNGIKMSNMTPATIAAMYAAGAVFVVAVPNVGNYKLSVTELIDLCKIPNVGAYSVLGNNTDTEGKPVEWDVLLAIDKDVAGSTKLATEKAIRDYIDDKMSGIDLSGYVKTTSATVQTIDSQLIIKNAAAAVTSFKTDTDVVLANIGVLRSGKTKGIEVVDGSNVAILGNQNEWGNEGPTLFMSGADNTSLRLNMRGLYYYGKYYNGYLSASDVYNSNTVSGSIQQYLYPDSNQFELSCYFPNVSGGFRSGNSAGEFNVNGNGAFSGTSFSVRTHDKAMATYDMPFFTNTGMYGGYKSDYQYGVSVYDKVNSASNRVSFVNGANEIAYVINSTTLNSLYVGKSGQANYLQLASGSTERYQNFINGRDDRSAQNKGVNDLYIGFMNYNNTYTNGTARVDTYWNANVDQTNPSTISTYLRAQTKCNATTFNAVHELRTYSSSETCCGELYLESGKSSDSVTLRAADATYSSKLDLNWTKMRLDMHDRSSTFSLTSKLNTSRFMLDYNTGARQAYFTDLTILFDGTTTLTAPKMTGIPTAPTAASGTSTTQLATTAFVNQSKPNGTVVSLTTTQTIVPTDGKIYKITGTGLTITLSPSGSGTCYIQNDHVADASNIIVFNDVANQPVQIILLNGANDLKTASFHKTTSGYMKL